MTNSNNDSLPHFKRQVQNRKTNYEFDNQQILRKVSSCSDIVNDKLDGSVDLKVSDLLQNSFLQNIFAILFSA